MSEGPEKRGTEPIEEKSGTESEDGEGGRNTTATPPIGEDAEKGQTQAPAESDDAGVGGAGTEDERP
jgi:hypothetical protein